MAERRPGLRTPPTPPELRLHVLMGEVLRRFGNYMSRVADLELHVEALLAWRDELTGGTGGGMSGHQLGQKPWAEPEAGTVPEPQPGSDPAAARGDAVTSGTSAAASSGAPANLDDDWVVCYPHTPTVVGDETETELAAHEEGPDSSPGVQPTTSDEDAETHTSAAAPSGASAAASSGAHDGGMGSGMSRGRGATRTPRSAPY